MMGAFRRLVLRSPAYTLSSFRTEYWDRRRPPPQMQKIGTSSLSEVLARLNVAIQKKNALPRHELDLLLDRFGEFGCYDPRDKVYGLLSLVERGPEVDYAKTTEQVFKDLLDHMFRVGRAYTTWGDVSRMAATRMGEPAHCPASTSRTQGPLGMKSCLTSYVIVGHILTLP